LMDCKCE